MPDQPKRVVIIGAGGMLGQALTQEAGWRGLEVRRYPSRRELDITDSAAVDDALGRHPADIVINAAAWTNVDGAEADAMSAYEVNWSGPANLAWCCAHIGATLVHFSTEYVFDGTSETPYREDDETQPINAYGASKLAGEEAIRASAADHLIIRSSWLYAPFGTNFVRTILDRAHAPELPVVDDQRGRPTSCHDLARMTFDLIDAGARGTVHAANEGTCSWAEFAHAILAHAGVERRVRPCPTSDVPRPARRPANGVLDLTQLTQLIGAPRPWTDALAECMKDLVDTLDPAARQEAARWRIDHKESRRAAA